MFRALSQQVAQLKNDTQNMEKGVGLPHSICVTFNTYPYNGNSFRFSDDFLVSRKNKNKFYERIGTFQNGNFCIESIWDNMRQNFIWINRLYHWFNSSEKKKIVQLLNSNWEKRRTFHKLLEILANKTFIAIEKGQHVVHLFQMIFTYGTFDVLINLV